MYVGAWPNGRAADDRLTRWPAIFWAAGAKTAMNSTTDHYENQDESRAMGQFGGGLEVRITRHIGITGDFSWNVVDGPHNNFGMVRSGLNFAF